MSAFTAQGKLWIELADFYVWMGAQDIDCEGTKAPRFSVPEDALVLEFDDAREPIYVDAADLWNWVIEEHLPDGLLAGEIAFGVPKVDGSDLTIEYAASTEGHPSHWTTPPAFLAEWTKGDEPSQAA